MEDVMGKSNGLRQREKASMKYKKSNERMKSFWKKRAEKSKRLESVISLFSRT
ncbi:hypothetical protein I8F94_09995 [Enterococcus gallinarum]|nr:hypothetical protein [Enterococcus gallinarum]